MPDAPPTKVIFRKYPEGAIIALFPEELGSGLDEYSCSSYMHIGQHDSADPSGVIFSTHPARPDDYESLKEELERIGYVLEVKQKYTVGMQNARRKSFLEEHRQT